LRVIDMVKSNWVYRKLRNFRAGIGPTSRAERAYGLARCQWRGLERFVAYVWSSTVACNLAHFASQANLTLCYPPSRPPLGWPPDQSHVRNSCAHGAE